MFGLGLDKMDKNCVTFLFPAKEVQMQYVPSDARERALERLEEVKDERASRQTLKEDRSV